MKRIETSFNGLPISKEWRCFFYKGTLLSSGWYWSSHPEGSEPLPVEALPFLQTVAKIVSQRVNAFVVDIGEKEEGGYIVVELNILEMAGLSECNPGEFYSNLYTAVKKEIDSGNNSKT